MPPVLCLLLLLPFDASEAFPEVYNSETLVDAEPLSPQAAAAGFTRTMGYDVTVFAAEPDVRNPIGMTWDGSGRLWVAENYTYAERSQKFDLSLRDRVVVLRDSDGDHVADERTVFTDDVQMLTSVEVGRGGVWLMCPPQLLFIPDADADLQPDGPAEVVLDGFTVAAENYHNFANGLRFGPDGWLYGRCGGSCPGRIGKPGTPDASRTALEGGIWRYHPETQHFEVLCHGTTNPWGHGFTQYGEGFFINTVNGHLWHLIAGAHFKRPFTLDPNPYTYELIDQHADHYHFDTSGAWNESRDGVANEYGGGHAHVGMTYAYGEAFPPELQDSVLTWNMHGRRLNCNPINRLGSGFVGVRAPDLLLSNDDFFRGMELSVGPDNAVYVIDWSDTGECHDHTGVHRTSGRVYRMALSGCEDLAPARFRSQVANQGEAFRGFTDGNPFTGQPTAAELFASHRTSGTSLHTLRASMDWDDERLRAAAVRLASDHWPIDDVFGPVGEPSGSVREQTDAAIDLLCEIARTDGSGLVRLSLASCLQRLPLPLRPRLAIELTQHAGDATDHNLPLLVWYGLIPVAEHMPGDLVDVAIACRWPQTQRFIARRIASGSDRDSSPLDRLLLEMVDTSSDAQLTILQGISDGFQGWTAADAPASWSAVSAQLADQSTVHAALVRDLDLLFGDGRGIEEAIALITDESNDIELRRTTLQSLVRRSVGDEVVRVCLGVLRDPRLNVVASEGLAKSNDPRVASELVKNYRRFRSPQRPKVIAILCSRPSFATALLNAIEANRIPVAAVSAFDVRQIRAMDDPELTARLSAVWGDVRETPEEKQQQIQTVRALVEQDELTNLSSGRALFAQSCAKCHKLFGAGEQIGPDLTGANRSNLDYLLENIIHPSAVVSKDYRMSIVRMEDGRVLSGLITTETPKTITLQTQTDLLQLATDEIEARKATTLSPMPEGLLDNLTEQQIVDLFEYLRSPTQVPLPAGAPSD